MRILDSGFLILDFPAHGGLAGEAMTPEDLKARTMSLAVRVLRLVAHLPQTVQGRTVAGQICRSATSVGANYRAALRSKSRADFINKIAIVLEEADETHFWLELIEATKLLPAEKIRALTAETEELVKIFNATRRSARNPES
jgi:four helix bundle protein